MNIILQDIEEQFGGYPAGVLIVADVVVKTVFGTKVVVAFDS